MYNNYMSSRYITPTKRRLLAISLIVMLLAAAYSAAGMMVYRIGTTVSARCEPPDSELFTLQYETVNFPSREDKLNIRASYIQADEGSPAVILVHGLGGCRFVPGILTAADMLHRAGYSVLMMDMRNHGESQVTTGRMAGGIHEYRDVLGAWDWLVTEQGIPPQRIGLFGTSLGGASVMIAAGEEPQVAAVWEDSSYAGVDLAIQNELRLRGYPGFLASAATTAGWFMDGLDLTARSPLKSVPLLLDRPLFITHGEADARMPVEHAYVLVDALHAAGRDITPWIVPGSGHVGAIFDHPDEYESRLIEFFQNSLNS
jgi:dipeptidyl aminopeptidase/acylaminoacyl peptidase